MKTLTEHIQENKISGNKFYLTIQGFERIKKDLAGLKEMRNLKVNGKVPEFWHSEELNPEYLVFQDDINLLDAKISDLEYILKNYEIIKLPSKKEQGKVHLGAKVLVDVNSQKDEFEIVGTLESDPLLGRISKDSPVGQALLGHSVGDEIVISSPAKTILKIKKIKYQTFPHLTIKGNLA